MLINHFALSVFVSVTIISDAMGHLLELSVEGEIGSVPVATALKLKDVFRFDYRHKGIVALKPVVAACVHPADVMTAISGAPLVGDDTNELVAAGVEARVEGPIQSLVVLPDLRCLLGSLCSRAYQFLLFTGLFFLLFLLLLVLHLDILALLFFFLGCCGLSSQFLVVFPLTVGNL